MPERFGMSFKKRFGRMLAAEQLAFLRRRRRLWGEHLERARAFIGDALQNADSSRPILILGAGHGLEIPWGLAPKSAIGWDADPTARVGTLLRHGRFPPWVFDDFTGSMEGLYSVALRVQKREGTWATRPAEVAARRLAGLLPSVPTSPAPLEEWLENNHPGTIICANVLGQVRPTAHRLVELAFKPRDPWLDDPDLEDPLQEALDVWTARAIRAVLAILGQRGAKGAGLYLLHDRGVIHNETDLSLGAWADPWTAQLKTGATGLEVEDPLPGVDVLEELKHLRPTSQARWLWPLGPGQTHVVEALAFK